MIIDAHAYVTPGMHGQTRTGPTRSLPYGRVQHGDQVVQMLPPFSADRTALEAETMLRLMDWVGIAKTVLMQGPFYGDQNALLHQAVKKWPDRFTAAGLVDPSDKKSHDVFRRITQDFGFRILAFDWSEATGLSGLQPELHLDGDEMTWFWEQADRLGLVLNLNLGRPNTPSYQTDALRMLVERFAQARVVIAHLAHPPLTDPGNEQTNNLWREQAALARFPNVWLDISGLPSLGLEDYPFPTALRYIREAVGLVGAEKLIWGSDVPGQLCHATFPQLFNMFALHSGLDDGQLQQIFGETARRVYWPAGRQ
jgi:predicted TIM-barrel fold metal-dependent hydrolase